MQNISAVSLCWLSVKAAQMVAVVVVVAVGIIYTIRRISSQMTSDGT